MIQLFVPFLNHTVIEILAAVPPIFFVGERRVALETNFFSNKSHLSTDSPIIFNEN